MNRLDREAGSQVVNTIGYLRTTLNDIRQDQTFGSSDVRTYRLFDPTTNVDFTLSGVTTTTCRCVEVTLSPRTSANNPVIAFDFSVSLTSPSGGTALSRYDPLPPYSGNQVFRVYVMSQDVTKDISLSFNFWTISPGTYSYQEVTP